MSSPERTMWWSNQGWSNAKPRDDGTRPPPSVEFTLAWLAEWSGPGPGTPGDPSSNWA